MGRFAFVSLMEGQLWGGSEELWSQTALRLLKQGEEVYASCKGWPTKHRQHEELERAGCRIWYRRPSVNPRRSLARRAVGKLRRTILPAPLAPPPPEERWLGEVRPELLVLSLGYPYQGYEWMELCGRQEIPYVVVVHGAGEFAWPGDQEAQRFVECHRGAVKTLFVSEGNRELVRVQVADPLPRSGIVRNPCNVPFDAAPAWPKEEPFKLASVGLLSPQVKGQDLTLRVLAQAKWRERPLQVTIFGSGPGQETLRRLRDMLGVESVQFAGSTEDIEEVWRTHHALLAPSRNEGLPLVVVEAMLCGRPCIVTNVAGNAEIVEDGVNGFIAQAPTVELLDAAMERAWERRSDWRAMGQNAAHKIRATIPTDAAGVFSEELQRLLALSQGALAGVDAA